MTSQELLPLCNEYLSYNPETGIFIWKKDKGSRAVKGNSIESKNDYGYLIVRLNGRIYRQHRLAFLIHHKWMPEKIDHENEIKTDNRIVNLRPCTQSQNMMNRGSQKNSKSGYKGVCWYMAQSKWHAQININGKRIHLGYFFNKIEAAQAYNKAALKYHGDFAWLNPIP